IPTQAASASSPHSLRDGNSRLEPGNSLETETGQLLLVAVKGERHNHIEIGIHQLEPLRHDSHDFSRLRIDCNAAPDYGSVPAEAALPVAVAEHYGFPAMRNLIRRPEPATK